MEIRWILKRFGFLKRILLEFVDYLFYQKSSQFLLHSWNAHKTPYKSIIYYNFFGRIFLGLREFLALLTNEKLFKKGILLEGFCKDLKEYKRGSHEILWPKSPMLKTSKYKLDDDFCKKIELSLKLSQKKELQNFDKTLEWERIASLITQHFLDKSGKIIKENLINFRADAKLYQELFNDEFYYLDPKKGFKKLYLDAIDLVLEQHRLASKVDKTILATLSESRAGNNLCAIYRGKRLSQKSMFHSLIVDDIVKIVPFTPQHRSVIVDIGSGYGGLVRILSFYTPNCCHILLDLPETLILTSYFIKYNFPEAKIALLDDLSDLQNFDKYTKEYDFIIIPPSVLKSLKSKSVDLVINSASMGFMQKEYQEFYLEEIGRILKSGGYFYSLNKEYDDKWGRGFYGWDYKKEYITRVFEYNNRFSYPQWLGQKI